MQQKNASRRKPQSSAPAGRTAAARPARSAQPADRAQAELRPLPGLAYGVLDELLGYALRRAQNALYLHFQRSVDRADVSPQRFAALVLVAQNPGLRQGLLADAMGLHRSGGMRLTDWLCEQGWVQRADDPLDRRSWTVHPTPAGLALLESVTAQVRTHDEALLAALEAMAVHTRALVFANRHGQTIYEDLRGLAAGSSHPQLSIHRGHLQMRLWDEAVQRLGTDQVRTGERVVAARGQGQGRRQAADAAAGHNDGAGGVHRVSPGFWG